MVGNFWAEAMKVIAYKYRWLKPTEIVKTKKMLLAKLPLASANGKNENNNPALAEMNFEL
ncbi:MAG: hypothetical protein HY063_13100 [Bacteroidetes bacterium]|nr:hypothetical protein [Bacteroidota bacterium]